MQIRFIRPALAILLASASTSFSQPLSTKSDPDIAAIAAEAYVFGFPLVVMHTTMRVQTNVVSVNPYAPLNQVGSLFKYPTAALTDEPPSIPAKLQGLELGPACAQCGGMMQRTGSCYTCSSCGNNTGCG